MQFEAIQYRLEHEYGAKCRYEPIKSTRRAGSSPTTRHSWRISVSAKYNNMALDKRGREVFLADTSYALSLAMRNFPTSNSILRPSFRRGFVRGTAR
ncbi:MAG: hypothetical protein ACLTZY_13635 [Alistipes indistinctus]